MNVFQNIKQTTMTKETYYLVYVQIEDQDGTSDCHTLYKKLEDAHKAMQKEKAISRKDFPSGKVVLDWERCYEFRNEDGYGYIVGIDELTPQ